MILNFIIIVTILTFLTYWRAITNYDVALINSNAGNVPNNFGFYIFAHIGVVGVLVNLVWIFGGLIGFILILCCYFQIVYAAVLWVHGIPNLLRDRKYTNVNIHLYLHEISSRAASMYGIFSLIVMALFPLAIINFFVSDYASLKPFILDNLTPVLVTSLAIFVLSWFSRPLFLAWLEKDNLKPYKMKKREQTATAEQLQAIKLVEQIREKDLEQHPDQSLNNKYFDTMEDVIDDSEHFNTSISGMELHEWVYGTLTNVIGNEVTCGELHFYRGLLSPQGEAALRLFDLLIDEALNSECRYRNENGLHKMTEEFADGQKAIIRQEIEEAG